jgi:hypothetical protein
MAPARSADSMWTRLGQTVCESGPVVWFNDSVRGHPAIGRTRRLALEVRARVYDICYPLIVLARGTRRGVGMMRGWWGGSSKEKRRLQVVVVVVCLVGVAVLRYGPVLLVLAFLAAAGWLGRDTSRKGADPETKQHIARLQAVYNGLVPYLQDDDDPDKHFKPGGNYRDAFKAWEFDEQDRLVRLAFDYSEYFRDGEADSRAKVERALEGKIGHANEYLYAWDEEANRLEVRILPPLASDVAVQPWPVAEIEFVLGFTDPDSAGRTIPVLVPDPDDTEDTLTPEATAARGGVPAGFVVAQLAPVIWRIGAPDRTAHLLLTGGPMSGKSTAVRALLGQALERGHRIAVVDTDRTADYRALAGRPGVVRVAEDPAESLDLLEWVGKEAERRAAHGGASGPLALPAPVAPSEGPTPAPQGVSEAAEDGGERQPERPLWLFVDDLPELCAVARELGHPDPQDALAALAGRSRSGDLVLVVTARSEQLATLRAPLLGQLGSRIALGRVDPATSTLLFGGTLELGGSGMMPPGRGYARLGPTGPVIRLQSPYAPTLASAAV